MSLDPHEKGLGLIGQSPPDWRDRVHVGLLADPQPQHVDLTRTVNAAGKLCTPIIFDQGQLGSCTANAANAVIQYVEKKDGDPDYDRLSRLYTYYYSREKIGTVGEDSGALIRDTYAVLAERGAPREVFWPYDISKFSQQPPSLDYRAGQHKAIEYLSVMDGNEAAMAACLAEGYPFTYGFAVYRSFWDIGTDGHWTGEKGPIDGYHAVDAWGYDLRPGAYGFPNGGYKIRNQWGPGWGDHGYFYVSREYMHAETFDCWTVRKVVR